MGEAPGQKPSEGREAADKQIGEEIIHKITEAVNEILKYDVRGELHKEDIGYGNERVLPSTVTHREGDVKYVITLPKIRWEERMPYYSPEEKLIQPKPEMCFGEFIVLKYKANTILPDEKTGKLEFTFEKSRTQKGFKVELDIYKGVAEENRTTAAKIIVDESGRLQSENVPLVKEKFEKFFKIVKSFIDSNKSKPGSKEAREF